jgi:hypothetical protein
MGQAEADTLAVEPPPDPAKAGTGAKAKSQFDWTHLGPKGAAFFSAIVAKELTQAVPAITPYLQGN